MFEDRNPVYPKMLIPSPIILRVWESDFGLPSVDPESLQLLVLLNMHHANFVVHYAYCPQWINIPSIAYNDITVVKAPELMLYAYSLCKKTSDFGLDTEHNHIIAYKKYFMECFADVFYFDCWLNEVNYEHTIKTWFNNVIPFPFNYLYLKKMRTHARERFKCLLGPRDADKYMIRQYKYAARCLQDFASLLKDGRQYFLGDIPTSLDVIIYSYLAIALHMPLPDAQLQKLIKSHQVLVRFVRIVTHKYFPDTPLQFKYVEPVNASNDRASVKSLLMAGLCVTTVMFIYAYSIGLIKLHVPSFSNIQNQRF